MQGTLPLLDDPKVVEDADLLVFVDVSGPLLKHFQSFIPFSKLFQSDSIVGAGFEVNRELFEGLSLLTAVEAEPIGVLSLQEISQPVMDKGLVEVAFDKLRS